MVTRRVVSATSVQQWCSGTNCHPFWVSRAVCCAATVACLLVGVQLGRECSASNVHFHVVAVREHESGFMPWRSMSPNDGGDSTDGQYASDGTRGFFCRDPSFPLTSSISSVFLSPYPLTLPTPLPLPSQFPTFQLLYSYRARF